MQVGRKAVWTIPYIFVAFFPILKHNVIAYLSSKVSDCIFEIHQLWQSRVSKVYSDSLCSCFFEPEIMKIGQSSHKMYSTNVLNFQESTTILNACTKNVWKLIECITYVYAITEILVGLDLILINLCYFKCCFSGKISICTNHWLNTKKS